MPTKSRVNHGVTSKERIALIIISHWMGETFANRTSEEYVRIAGRLPKLDALHAYVNETLADMARRQVPVYEICYFRAGDRSIWYEEFPTSLSKETVRSALVKSGFWQLRRQSRDHLAVSTTPIWGARRNVVALMRFRIARLGVGYLTGKPTLDSEASH